MPVSYLHGLETIELNDGIRPVETIKSSVIGLVGTAPDADPLLFPLNTPVALFADATKANALGKDGTLLDAVNAIYSQKSAVVVVVRVEEGNDMAATWSNAAGSPTARTGVWALLKARPTLRVVPKILIAPGLTMGRAEDAANPVAKALEAAAERLRAVAFVDGPGTTYEDAIAYREDFESARLMVIDPGVKVWDTETNAYVVKPASAYAAGIQARVDQELGFWYPFSNNQIRNVGGPGRPVDFMPNDRDCEANMLNAAQITTIIHDDGFRFWGLRGTGEDSLWAQMAVRRTADMIYESLERAERIRLDKPFTYQLLAGIQGDVNAYLRLMKARGALINGRCWIDPTVNTAQTFAAGQLTVDFDLEPAASLEHLQFRTRRNPGYYEQFIEEFARLNTGA